jgi:2'-5' RNA ligase
LRLELPEASWTRPESWHLTLHFLGEISEEEAARFAGDFGPLAAGTPGGDLVASGAVVFPSRGPARVIGVGFETTAFTAALESLGAAARRLAPGTSPKESRRFLPHVTFARLRLPWPRGAVESFCRAAGEWRPPVWRARSCVLFRSRLDPAGAVHTPMATWALSSVPAGAPA